MIVIPMAGLSRRFSEAGYTLPKYMLSLDGESVFEHAVNSFKKYFPNTEFLFVARDVYGTRDFIINKCVSLNIINFQIAIIDHETAGQAETVEIGLSKIKAPLNEPVTVFNIDTFRPGFTFPKDNWFSTSDGYLEVFEGTGNNWSYVGPYLSSDEPLVERTTEKNPISNLCCNGLYHFSRQEDFLNSLSLERRSPSLLELYIAPLYNHMISQNKRIHYHLIKSNEVFFCGTPGEYELEQERRGARNL